MHLGTSWINFYYGLFWIVRLKSVIIPFLLKNFLVTIVLYVYSWLNIGASEIRDGEGTIMFDFLCLTEAKHSMESTTTKRWRWWHSFPLILIYANLQHGWFPHCGDSVWPKKHWHAWTQEFYVVQRLCMNIVIRPSPVSTQESEWSIWSVEKFGRCQVHDRSGNDRPNLPKFVCTFCAFHTHP